MADSLGRLISCAVILGLGSLANAQTFNWANSLSGDWDADANWVEPGFPQLIGDMAIIDVDGAAYVVDLAGFIVNIGELELTSVDATLSGAGGGSVTINDQVTFSNATVEDMTFDSLGGLLFDSTVCDDLCDIFMMQTGPTAVWQNVGDIQLLGTTEFTIGPATTFMIDNAQSMFIDDAATMDNQGSILKSVGGTTSFMRLGATGTFANPGSLEVTAGAFDTDALDLIGDTLAEGTWIVRGGSALNLLGQSVITNQASVTLDGPGSTFPAFDANISFNDPTGVITIEGARTFTTPTDFTNDGIVDVGAGSTFTVDLGSSFTNFTGGMIVGGELDLEGTFQFTGAAIETVDADVILDGPGAAIVDELFVDALSSLDMIMPGGMLALVNGKDLTVTEPVLMVEGALMVGPEFGGDFSVLTATGDIDQPAGVTMLDAGTIMHGGTYMLHGTGQLRGNGTITGPLLNAGRIAPGFSPGEVFFQPQLEILVPGVLEIEIGGLIPVVEHDRIIVFGDLQFELGLAGTLEIILIDGFEPNVGDVFEIVLANNVNGQFQNVIAPNLDCELDVQVNYIEGKEFDVVQVEIVEDCIADCNDDGEVDILDFMCFQMEWQNQTPCGDCNGDGEYDILDWVCFQNEWQMGC